MKCSIKYICIILCLSLSCTSCTTADDKEVNTAIKSELSKSKIEAYLEETHDRIEYWTKLLEDKSPAYIWGGVGEKGGDCSGQMYYIFHKSGLPYLRTTALQMWNGAWPGRVIKSWEYSKFPNLIYFTFSDKRPSGHVGIIRENHYPKYLIYSEASSSAKVFKKSTLESKSKKNSMVTGIQELDLMVGFPNPSLTKKSK